MTPDSRARAAIGALMLRYNPAQRRDGDGRWIKGPKLPPGSSETPNGPGGTEAPPEFAVATETTGDPSLMLRADAATAALELFGFNPHQLRGPDGKFIKMPASQLRNKRNERARARRAAKKAEKERAAGGDSSAPPNVARDGYNSEILDRAGAVSNALRAMERPDRELEREIDKLTDAMGSDNPRDADKAADRVRERMEAHGDLVGKLRPAPDGRGTSAGKIESDAPDQADAAHRRARDGFNRQVLAEAQNVKNDNEFDGVDDAELELQIDQLDAALADGDASAADDWADALHSRMADKYPDAAIPAKPQPPAAANSVEIDEAALQQRFKDALDDYNAEIHVMGKAWIDMLRDPDVRNDPDSGLDHLSDAWVNQLGSHVLGLRKAILNGEGDKADEDANRIRAMLVGEQLQADHDFPHKPTLDELRNEALAQARGIPVPPNKTSGLLTSGAPISDRRAALEAAVAAGVWGEEPIGQGAMGETKKVVFNDGTRAVYKKAKGDWAGSIAGDPWTPKHQTDAEEMASLVGAALGLRAPAVQRISDDEINMELVENAGPAMNRFFDKTAPDYVRVPGEVMGSDDGLLMGLFDTLIDNPDRHGFNWMIDDQNRVFPIDHGLSFMNVRGTPNLYSAAGRSPFASEYFVDHVGNLKENILSRRDITYVRQQLAPLEAEFERVGRPGWYRVMQMRLDAIERRAKGGASHQLPAPRQE